MLNSIKIKLRTLLLSRKRKANPVFVNPYAPIAPISTAKINPYAIDFGVVKKKSAAETIVEWSISARNDIKVRRIPSVEVVPVKREPTFIDDMNEMLIRDIMGVASRFTTSKKKEKVMTSAEILKACENTKW